MHVVQSFSRKLKFLVTSREKIWSRHDRSPGLLSRTLILLFKSNEIITLLNNFLFSDKSLDRGTTDNWTWSLNKVESRSSRPDPWTVHCPKVHVPREQNKDWSSNLKSVKHQPEKRAKDWKFALNSVRCKQKEKVHRQMYPNEKIYVQSEYFYTEFYHYCENKPYRFGTKFIRSPVQNSGRLGFQK